MLLLKCLAMTYSRVLDAHYHWRWCVSLPSSGWDRVVPHRYGRQAKGLSLGLMLGLRLSRWIDFAAFW